MDVRFATLVRKKELVVLILCLLVGFSLRFYKFDKKSLWMDEVYTFNDSRDDLKGQFKWYRENPTFLHPPLFFILTHQFYPFEKPERDLRIIPLIFGTLSVPMIYLLAKSLSPGIALPCALSLSLMTYHISLSQDGRCYSFLMCFGMAGLYFFVQYLKTLKRGYLALVAFIFAILLHTSYSSIPFIALSQMLWFYRPVEGKRPALSAFLFMNGLLFLFCLPWITFLAVHYKGQALADPLHTEEIGSFWFILSGVLHDWMPHLPLTIVAVLFFILWPILSRQRRNAFILLGICFGPIVGLFLYCKLLDVRHFITSRYFINFMPVFMVSLYLAAETIDERLGRLTKFLRWRLIFLVLFIASNLVILPLYYRSEKQDFRGLVTFLKGNLRPGDRIFADAVGYFAGILHYFGTYPENRHYEGPYYKDSQDRTEYHVYFTYRNRPFTVINSKICCGQYVADGNRLWIVVAKANAIRIKGNSPAVLKGFFDGSFLSYTRFPIDASIYLFLWDPLSPFEKGIEMPIE